MPLIGKTGMMKNSVMNRVPCSLMKVPTAPHLPHFIWLGAGCEPQEKKCTPMIKKEIMCATYSFQ
jgi:hypothetical protein